MTRSGPPIAAAASDLRLPASVSPQARPRSGRFDVTPSMPTGETWLEPMPRPVAPQTVCERSTEPHIPVCANRLRDRLRSVGYAAHEQRLLAALPCYTVLRQTEAIA